MELDPPAPVADSEKIRFGAADNGSASKARFAFSPGYQLDYELYRVGLDVDFEGDDLDV